MSRKWLSSLSLGLALSVAAAHAQVEPPSGTEQITESGGVYIYTLPANLQTVVEGDDNKYYAINYYTWYDPKYGEDGQVPGISLGQQKHGRSTPPRPPGLILRWAWQQPVVQRVAAASWCGYRNGGVGVAVEGLVRNPCQNHPEIPPLRLSQPR